ncbi:MAG: hypothetical protein GY842_07635 [bacterium]|nr:hypothetical protein [bacterium]
MAAAIKDEFEVDCELIRGGGGIFDVHADGELMFSKHQAGRFPEHAEVLERIATKAP